MNLSKSKKLLHRFALFIKLESSTVSLFCCLSALVHEARQYLYHPIRLIRLRKIDRSPIPHIPSEIRLFFVVRNEEVRLPYILAQYAKRGIDRFFVVDNGSTDGTVPFLLSQKNMHVFQTKEPYGNAAWGQKWINILLERYGQGHWCVVGDADEIFIYPHYETISLKELARYLQNKGYNVVNTLLLDMYSNKPICESEIEKGENLLAAFSYFDKKPFTSSGVANPELSNAIDSYLGGPRERTLGVSVCLNKAPFFNYSKKLVLNNSCHMVKGGRGADIEGATLHFKFSTDFIHKAPEEAAREQHWRKAKEYKCYTEILQQDPGLSLFYEDSVKFQDSRQLVELKIMKTSEEFERFQEGLSNTKQG